jgi:hypothetical protein
MSLTAGALSLVSKTDVQVVAVSAAATSGTAPYTYQWYRSTTSGFTPGAGNIISGATSLNLTDTGLIPNTTYYYKVVVTDDAAATAESAQLAVATLAQTQNPNQFAETALLGMVDLKLNLNTISVEVDASEMGTLYAGSPVVIVDSAGGIPKVVKPAASSDTILGFINYDIKSRAFVAGDKAEVSLSGNVIYLYATAAIARGAMVVVDVENNGVAPMNGSGGESVVGWAVDKAAGLGSLIRVFLMTPGFLKDGV